MSYHVVACGIIALTTYSLCLGLRHVQGWARIGPAGQCQIRNTVYLPISSEESLKGKITYLMVELIYDV